VIQSIRHKGLRLYYEKGESSKLPREQWTKLSMLLSALDAVSSENDIKALAHGIHQLKGKYKSFWSLTVTGNYRLVFRWASPDIHDVDYLDYH